MWAKEWQTTWRALAAQPRFTLVTVGTLALGLGATTAIFSVIYGVLLRPLPYPQPDRVMQVAQVHAKGGHNSLSDPNFRDLREQNRSFSTLAQYSVATVSVSGGGSPARLSLATVSSDFFEVMGVKPIFGRVFTPQEHQPNAEPTALVSYGYWQRNLGANPDLASQALTFSRRVHQVVGVMPPQFHFPTEAEIWIPRGLVPRIESRTAHNWRAVGRLADGVPVIAARDDMSAIARRLKVQFGDDTWMEDAAVTPLREQLVGDVSPALTMLMGAVSFLLLVACANVVNLLLVRAGFRQKELALRTALGASRWRLTRQFLTESMALSLMGAAAGLLLAWGGVRLLLSLEPGNLPRTGEIHLSPPVFVFALVVSVVTAMGLGLATALRATKGDVQQSLRQGQKNQAGVAGGLRLRGVLTSAQLAITLVLLLGAGLLGRSMLSILDVDPGFRTESRLVMDINSPAISNDTDKLTLSQFQANLIRELQALPEVRRAGAVDLLPIQGGGRNGVFLIMQPGEKMEDYEAFGRMMKDPSRVGTAEYRAASSDYFHTMEIPLLRGRLFDERDSFSTLPVALISERLAEARWPTEDPLGKLIQFGNMDGDLRPLTVIGIVGDVRHRGLDTDPVPTLYTHIGQRPRPGLSVVMDFAVSEPTATIASARAIVRQLAPDVPPRFRTIDQVVSSSLADRRFHLVLLLAFGIAALVLAGIGIYGVTSYGVSLRTREIGIRLALGALPGDVVRSILGQGARWIGIGIALGLVAGLALTRVLEGFLFGVSAFDPLTCAAVAGLLAICGLLACYTPARRATRLDPMVCLRED